jgi:hypothetical protein
MIFACYKIRMLCKQVACNGRGGMERSLRWNEKLQLKIGRSYKCRVTGQRKGNRSLEVGVETATGNYV